MEDCCIFILNNSQDKQISLYEKKDYIFSKISRQCAKSILNALFFLKNLMLKQDENLNLYSEAFRIHTKGKGLICIKYLKIIFL